MAIQQRETDGRHGGTRSSHQARDKGGAQKPEWFSIGQGAAQLAAPGALSTLIGVRDSDDALTLLHIVGVREVLAGVGILTDDRPSRELWARGAGDLLDPALLGSAFGQSPAAAPGSVARSEAPSAAWAPDRIDDSTSITSPSTAGSRGGPQ